MTGFLGLPPLGVLLSPSNVAIGLVLAGLGLQLIKPARGVGAKVLMAASVMLFAIAVLPVGHWLLGPLERAVPEFRPGGRPVHGIIILGGGVSMKHVGADLRPQPNRAIDRLFRGASLAKAFPDAAVIVSGGPPDPWTGISEADAAKDYLVALGVWPNRIISERQSANTFQNARFSAALAHPQGSERWLLVTSAFHMPRAMATFRSAGFAVEAAPADYRADGADWGAGSVTANLQAVDTAAKEYLGLLAYRISGRTTELWPGGARRLR